MICSIAGKGKKQVTFDKIAIAQATEYAAEDADITMKLHQVLRQELQQSPSLVKVFNDIELPLVKVLSKMEHNGVLIDSQALLSNLKKLQED